MGDQSEAGSIRFRGDAIDCIVREISETSAALELVSELYVPDAFTLAVPSEDLIRSCHVVWRVGRRIGVTFANASKPRTGARLISSMPPHPRPIVGMREAPIVGCCASVQRPAKPFS
jgi:hypothetical protein